MIKFKLSKPWIVLPVSFVPAVFEQDALLLEAKPGREQADWMRKERAESEKPVRRMSL